MAHLYFIILLLSTEYLKQGRSLRLQVSKRIYCAVLKRCLLRLIHFHHSSSPRRPDSTAPRPPAEASTARRHPPEKRDLFRLLRRCPALDGTNSRDKMRIVIHARDLLTPFLPVSSSSSPNSASREHSPNGLSAASVSLASQVNPASYGAQG